MIAFAGPERPPLYRFSHTPQIGIFDLVGDCVGVGSAVDWPLVPILSHLYFL